MSTIDALLAEREGYRRRGLDDRVRQVDEALAALGHVVVADDAPVEQATAAPGELRASRRRRG